MRAIIFSLIAILISTGSALGACEYDRLTGNSFTWPGSEDGEFSSKAKLKDSGFALFDSVHSFDVLHYQLILDFPMNGPYFEGSMTMDFAVVDDSLGEITLDMVHLTAESATLNGNWAPFDRGDSTITVDFDDYYYAGDTLILTIFYHDTTTNRGYYYFQRDAYTFAEPQDARWWFPCFDEPWDKATSDIFATVPENYEVGSNGYLESVYHYPNDHVRVYHWVNEDPIATYLINLVMADYAVWTDYYVTGSGDSIPIVNMVFAEDSSDAVFDFGNVPAMMETYSDLFYPYPFNKYGQAAIYPFQYGAMEHQTMTSLKSTWLRGDRYMEGGIAHELAHMWWGDFVTLADWRHIWLNEGFATYSGALFNEEFYGHEAFMRDLGAFKDLYLEWIGIYGYEPLFDPDYLFASTEYFKGAWVLHMLRGIIGDNAFFAGLHQYASLYGYGNASTWDFWNVMETASGRDLDWFFHEWIFDQAHPIYDYAWSYDGAGPYTVHLDIEQVQTAAPPFRMPIDIRITSAGGPFNFTVENNLEFQSYDFVVDIQPTGLLFDPDSWILKEMEWETSIGDHDQPVLPQQVSFDDPYPNPFNGSTVLTFGVTGSSQEVNIAIYDINGRLARGLVSGLYQPGYYVNRWDGRDDNGLELSSGIYLAKLTSPLGSLTKKLTFLR